jgi:hypothetical protein
MTQKQLEKKIKTIYKDLRMELGGSQMDLVDELVTLEIKLALIINK